MSTDPITTGELVRRFDRMEGSILSRLDRLDEEFVSKHTFDERSVYFNHRMLEVETTLDTQTASRRQIVVGAILIVLGNLAALSIAIANLADRSGVGP